MSWRWPEVPRLCCASARGPASMDGDVVADDAHGSRSVAFDDADLQHLMAHVAALFGADMHKRALSLSHIEATFPQHARARPPPEGHHQIQLRQTAACAFFTRRIVRRLSYSGRAARAPTTRPQARRRPTAARARRANQMRAIRIKRSARNNETAALVGARPLRNRPRLCRAGVLERGQVRRARVHLGLAPGGRRQRGAGRDAPDDAGAACGARPLS